MRLCIYLYLIYVIYSLRLASGKPEDNSKGEKSYIVESEGEELEDRNHFIVETQQGLGESSGDIETRAGGGKSWSYLES